MSFKDISYLELWLYLYLASETVRAILVEGYYEEQFRNYFEFVSVVQVGMSFKDISYLELWQPLCSV